MDIDDVNGVCISTAANRMSGGHINDVKVLVCEDMLLGEENSAKTSWFTV